jgi:hypothetical protein
MTTKTKIPLTPKDRRQLRQALAAKTFDKALNLTPGAVLDRMFEASGGTDGAHNLFDEDMFPKGWTRPSQAELKAAAARVKAKVKRQAKKGRSRRPPKAPDP